MGKKILTLLLMAVLSSPFITYASEIETVAVSEEQKKLDHKEYINHHLMDSYDFTIWHAAHLEFPLPIILFDDGLKIFSSSRFHNDNHVAEFEGNYYTINHHNNKIYKTDASGTVSYTHLTLPTTPYV